MTDVKLKATLPKDEELNGLAGNVIVDEFLADPRKPRVAIVVLQTEEIVDQLANGVRQPKVRVNRIELVTDAEEATDLLARAKALSEQRTGTTPLPVKEFGADVLDFSETRKPKGGASA